MYSFLNKLSAYSDLALIRQIGESIYFQAIQTGTSRETILEILDPDNNSSDTVSHFLEKGRIKATIDCPHVCSVYEAKEENGILYISHEKPCGENAEQLIQQGKTLITGDFLCILETLAQTSLYFEQRGIATTPLSLENIFISGSTVSLINPAIPGERAINTSRQDLITLGKALKALISIGTPGSTRMNTICSMMSPEHTDISITWEQVNELIETVREQMGTSTGHSTKILTVDSSIRKRRQKRLLMIWLGIGIILIGTIISILSFDKNTAPPITRYLAPCFHQRDHTLIQVTIDTPDITTNHEKGSHQLFCDAHEVTIQAYARFLSSLNNMPDSGQGKFNHPDQPKTKQNHTPEDWDNMLKAASNNQTWQERPISMRHPIVNIDYWDAYAYANWKGHRLPTRKEWMAIAENLKTNGNADPAKSVDHYDNDVASNGLCGFSSGVEEWTSSKERDSLHPTEPAQQISCGGTSIQPGRTQIHYNTSPEDKKPTLGFRTVRD
ncbi:MAG: SUMF1/EgtB/PvdO family nonheme iron enzyme [Akkermansia sp.]